MGNGNAGIRKINPFGIEASLIEIADRPSFLARYFDAWYGLNDLKTKENTDFCSILSPSEYRAFFVDALIDEYLLREKARAVILHAADGVSEEIVAVPGDRGTVPDHYANPEWAALALE